VSFVEGLRKRLLAEMQPCESCGRHGVTTFWFVTTVDTSGRESRQSNEQGR